MLDEIEVPRAETNGSPLEPSDRISLGLGRRFQLSRFYSAIFRSVLSRYCAYAVQVISVMVLARIFSPEQYGVIAAIQVFYIFFQMIAEIGIGPALINFDKIAQQELDGIFLLTLLLGGVSSALFLCCGVYFERFYQIPGVSKVVPFAAGALFFYAASIVPAAALNRELQFDKIAKATAVAEIISSTFVILIDRHIDPIRALASKMPVTAAAQFIFLYIFCIKTDFGRLGFSMKVSAARRILWFSTNQFLFSLVNYFSRNLDNILVGRVMGAGVLGIYDKAYQLMKYPLQLLTFAMTPAIQPAIRQHSDDPERVERIHRDFIYKLAWLGLAAGFAVAVSAPLIVRILLGSHWQPVVPIIRQLALSISTQVVLSTSGGFFQAMNRPDLLFLCGLLSACLIVLAIAFGIFSRDLVLMSWLISLAIDLNFIQCYYVLYKFVFKTRPQLFFAKMRVQMALTASMLALGSPFVLRAIGLR